MNEPLDFRDEMLLGRAQAWAQRVANARFAAWLWTKAGKKWKSKRYSNKQVTPSECGFDVGADVHEMNAAIGSYDVEKMKGLLLEYPDGRGGANGL